MRNLLNCHCLGLHSFPISFENGLYRRIFYADRTHPLWKPIELAIHPHHVDIKITVLEGELNNPIFRIDDSGMLMNSFKWNSHILNGKGGFEHIGEERLILESNINYNAGESVLLKACELHTVQIDEGKECVWLIEEFEPSCEYFPINYSPFDLTKWNTDGLYCEVSDNIKQMYIGKYLDRI